MQGNHNFSGDGLLNGQAIPSLLPILFGDETALFPAEGQPVRFLNNHDTDRIASEVEGNMERQQLAISFLAAMPGPIMIYYGEEIGMPGRKGPAPHWDSYRREPMDWYENEEGPGQTNWFMVQDRWNAPDDGISVEEQESDVESLLNTYRHVLALRESNQVFQDGDVEFLKPEWSQPGGVTMLLESGEELMLVVFNFGDEAASVEFAEFPLVTGAVHDLLSGESLPDGITGNVYLFEIGPRSAYWLVIY